MKGRIVIITGSPGTGKTTVSGILAEISDYPRTIHLHTDDFYHYLRKGFIPPQLPESNEQNRVVVEAILRACQCFADNGYCVIVDGIIGPWFIEPWVEAARKGCEIHYIILRAGKDETLRRAISRDKLGQDANTELVESMWSQFDNLGEFEKYVVDASAPSPDVTALHVNEGIISGRFRL